MIVGRFPDIFGRSSIFSGGCQAEFRFFGDLKPSAIKTY